MNVMPNYAIQERLHFVTLLRDQSDTKISRKDCDRVFSSSILEP